MRIQVFSDNRGFTLIEVIVVLVLMAIFAVLAVSHQPQTDMTLRAAAEVLKSHLRYAQARAMSSDTPWGMTYEYASQSYWLFRQSPDQKIPLPGETEDTVYLAANGVSIGNSNFTIVFDGWGRPIPADSTLPFPARVATLSLTKAGESQTITIRQNTGYVQ